MSDHEENSSGDSRRSKEERFSDWLQTIGTVATSGILVVLTIQQMNSSKEDQQNRVMADYVKQMTVLRVEHGLSPTFLSRPMDDWREKAKQEQVKLAARDNTLNAARQLDGRYKGRLLKYLYDTGLIGVCPIDTRTSQLDFKNCQDGFVELSGILLKEAVPQNDVPRARFLNGVDLRSALLEKADLSKAVLMGADLSGADLRRSKMSEAVLQSAKLVNAKLHNAKLQKVDMKGAILRGANLQRADLSGADLRGADLRSVDFSEAQLQDAKLEGAFYSEERDKQTKIPEKYKKVMRLCPDKISEELDLGLSCAPAQLQTQVSPIPLAASNP